MGVPLLNHIRPGLATALLGLAFPTIGLGQAVDPVAESAVAEQEVERLELASEPAVPNSPLPYDLDDIAGLEAWLDGFMDSHLERLPSAGATVSIVKDGQVLLARGFGLANVESDDAVDENTLFRIGSVSKLFTWTAIMQLVEQGLLDLDVDINTYMGEVQVPDTYDEPITLSHLLTHTAGFEDHVIGLFGRDEDSLRPLGEILQEEMPARVRPPGEAASYSNHGTGMAAYIVEQVTGMSFPEYIRQNILEPLGMSETTILQPVPAGLEDQLSTGYSSAGDTFDEEYFEYVPLAPVGAVSSSASDMAKLLIAYLQNGQLGDARILSEETALQMQSPLHRHAEGVNPALHGFMDMSTNGKRVIGHGGDTFWFHTLFGMLPEHDVGVFVSYNTDTGGAGRDRFLRAFLERYFPVPVPEAPVFDEAARERAERFVGNYRANRYTHSDVTKIGAAVGPLEVSVDSAGITTSATGSTHFIEVGPELYRAEDSHRSLAFRVDDAGNPTYLFLDPFAIVAFERADGIGGPGFQTPLFFIVLGVFALAVILWPLVAILRWRYKATPPPERRLPRWARFVTWLAAAGFIWFAVRLAAIAGGANDIALGDTGDLRFTLTVGLVAALLGAVGAGAAAWFWARGRGSVWTRVVFTAVALTCLVAAWQMNYWNLLGYRL